MVKLFFEAVDGQLLPIRNEGGGIGFSKVGLNQLLTLLRRLIQKLRLFFEQKDSVFHEGCADVFEESFHGTRFKLKDLRFKKLTTDNIQLSTYNFQHTTFNIQLSAYSPFIVYCTFPRLR